MTMTMITFTAIESDVLEHRLAHLSELDDDDLAELFPGQDVSALREAVCSLAKQFFAAVSLGLPQVAEIVSPVTTLVLTEALEGSTHHEMADESESAGMITPQKRTAYRTAMQSAAGKLSAIAGREIKLP